MPNSIAFARNYTSVIDEVDGAKFFDRPGYKATCKVPFSGDPGLFELQPNPHTMGAYEVDRIIKPGKDGIGYLVLSYELFEIDASAKGIEAHFAHERDLPAGVCPSSHAAPPPHDGQAGSCPHLASRPSIVSVPYFSRQSRVATAALTKQVFQRLHVSEFSQKQSVTIQVVR